MGRVISVYAYICLGSNHSILLRLGPTKKIKNHSILNYKGEEDIF